MMTTPNFYKLETANADLTKYNEFIQSPLDNTNGALHMPDAPGLGIEMNMDYLNANKLNG
jgi:galactonate dehydratase